MKRKYFFVIVFVLFAFIVNTCMLYDAASPPRQVAVHSLTLNRTSLALNLWTDDDYDISSATLTASVLPQTANQSVIWGSSDNSVATVSASGLVRAVGEGIAYITVITKDGGFMAKCEVLVVDQEPGPVQGVSIPSSMTLFIGGTDQQTLTPVFDPVFVTNENVIWTTSNASIARVSNGVVTAFGPGVADITVRTVDGDFTAVTTVRVTPLLAQFESITAFLAAANTFYRPGFDFGTAPATGDGAANTTTWSGTSTNHSDFVLYNTFDTTLFGRAGAGDLVTRFVHPNPAVASSTITPDAFRSHTQFNYASLAHFAFTGYRQAHPWGVHSLAGNTTRAGQTWSAGITAFAANTNTVQFSGIGVDLGGDTFFDTVVIYAGGNVNIADAFNSGDPTFQSLGIILEYMPSTAADAQTVFDRLYKPNSNAPTTNWNNPNADNNWPSPGYIGSPWIYGGRILPNGNSWVYVFHFEQAVYARFLRVSFEQAPAIAPGTGYLGRAFVNSFEVYHIRSAP